MNQTHQESQAHPSIVAKPPSPLGMAALALGLTDGAIMAGLLVQGNLRAASGWFEWLLISLPVALLLGLAGLFPRCYSKTLAVCGVIVSLLMCVAFVFMVLLLLNVALRA